MNLELALPFSIKEEDMAFRGVLKAFRRTLHDWRKHGPGTKSVWPQTQSNLTNDFLYDVKTKDRG